MKKMRKILGVTLSAAALMAASVFGTMAYLTDTEAVTNTFTVGKVQITLDEAKVDEYGKLLDNDNSVDTDGKNLAPRVQKNDYKLIPGYTYTKDPIIHVDADSENCYLFVKVENGIADIETKTGKTIAAQMKDLGWVKVDSNSDGKVDNADNVYVLAKGKEGNPDYKYTVGGGAHVEVFKNFTVDGDSIVNMPEGEAAPDGKFDIAKYADNQIVVTAYAVQAAGFEDSKAAWGATFGK